VGSPLLRLFRIVGYWLVQTLAACELLVLFAILNLSRFLR
jgi:hypothetical protein